MDVLVASFERLGVSEGPLPVRETASLKWGLHEPRQTTGLDVKEPYTIRPFPAPLPCFIRPSPPLKALRLLSRSKKSSQSTHASSAVASSSRASQTSRRRSMQPPKSTKVASPGRTPSSMDADPPVVELSTTATIAHTTAKPKRVTKKKVAGPPRRVPAGPPAQRKAATSAASPAQSAAAPLEFSMPSQLDMSTTPRKMSSSSAESLPSLSRSSSSSPSSSTSETQSPPTPFPTLPADFPPPVFSTDFSFDLSLPSKAPVETVVDFDFGLCSSFPPTFDQHGFPVGDFAMPPLFPTYDFTSLSA